MGLFDEMDEQKKRWLIEFLMKPFETEQTENWTRRYNMWLQWLQWNVTLYSKQETQR